MSQYIINKEELANSRDMLEAANQILFADMLSHFSEQGKLVPEKFAEQAKYYTTLSLEHGKENVSLALGLTASELTEFDRIIRDAARKGQQTDDGDQAVLKNAFIAQLRLLTWFETIGATCSGLEPVRDVEIAVSEDLCRKQVRSLELLLRSVIGAHYGTQDDLESALRESFRKEVFERWKGAADPGDILSGTTFGELSSLIVTKQHYPEYESVFSEGEFLTYLKSRRKTLQNFLEDIRKIRNCFAHNRQVTGIQLALLDIYYDEITSPLQIAYDEGETTVDPSGFLEDVTNEDLSDYFEALGEDVLSVKDDIDSFRTAMEEQLKVISDDTAEIRRTSIGMAKRLPVILCGIVLLILLGAGTVYQLQTSGEAIEEIDRKTEIISEGFASLDKRGGLIADPRSPAQWYHNARMHEMNADFGKARSAYRRLLEYDLNFVDLFLRYNNLLKTQDGPVLALEKSNSLALKWPNPSTRIAAALLNPREERMQRLNALRREEPDYGPAIYFKSLEFSEGKTGRQTLVDKEREKGLLEELFSAHAKGNFLRFYLDKHMGEAHLQEAKVRMAKAKWIGEEVLHAPVAIAYPFYIPLFKQWTIAIKLEDMANIASVSYSLSDDAKERRRDFQKGALTNAEKFYGGVVLSSLHLTATSKLTVSTIDIKGNAAGPFEFDCSLLAASTAKTLESFKANPGRFLGLEQLTDYKKKPWVFSFDGIAKTKQYPVPTTVNTVHYSIDSEACDQVVDVGSALRDLPHRDIPPDRVPMVILPEKFKYVMCFLTMADGTVTEKHRVAPELNRKPNPFTARLLAGLPTPEKTGPASELLTATRNGHYAIVEELLRGGADPNEGNLLTYAVRRKRTRIVALLLKHGATTNAKEQKGKSTMAAAITIKSPQMLSMLLKSKVDPNEVSGPSGSTPLLKAAGVGWAEGCRMLIEAKADVNKADARGLTPLGCVLGKHKRVRSLPTLKVLLAAGADPKAWACGLEKDSHFRRRSLHLAAEHGWSDATKLLLEYGAKLDGQDAEGATALYYAAMKKAGEVLELLLIAGASPDIAGRWQETPLHVCASGGWLTGVKQLLDKKASIDPFDRRGSTPLLSAMRGARGKDRLAVVNALLESGAEQLKCKRQSGGFALHLAVDLNAPEILEALLHQKPNIEQVDKYQKTPLASAVFRGASTKCVEVLLKHGANPNVAAYRGGGLLHSLGAQALRKHMPEVAKALIAAKANLNHLNRKNDTPLHEAVSRSNVVLARILLEAGADPNLPAKGNVSPLYTACTKSKGLEMVQLLLKNKAVPNTVTDTNRTPLDVARNDEIRKALVAAGAKAGAEITKSKE